MVECILDFSVTEGVYLHKFGIDPYVGDLFHETPIGLYVFNLMQEYLPQWALFLLFVVVDLTTALCLALAAKHYAIELVSIRIVLDLVQFEILVMKVQ